MQGIKNIILGLDTSGTPLLLAVQNGPKKAVRRRSGVKQERLLFPAIHQALAAVGGTLPQIGRIFIVRGPGRFTGIRISITLASMLRSLNQTEVRSATVFEVLRYQVENSAYFQRWKKSHPAGALAVIQHAFRQEYFLQIFDASGSAPQWLSEEELQHCLAKYPQPLFLAGTGPRNLPLEQFINGNYVFAKSADCRIRPSTLLSMAQLEQDPASALEPLYLKPARFEWVTPQ